LRASIKARSPGINLKVISGTANASGDCAAFAPSRSRIGTIPGIA